MYILNYTVKSHITLFKHNLTYIRKNARNYETLVSYQTHPIMQIFEEQSLNLTLSSKLGNCMFGKSNVASAMCDGDQPKFGPDSTFGKSGSILQKFSPRRGKI